MRYIYLHGFASGPQSRKAQSFRAALARYEITLEIPEIAPDFEHLTITSQLAGIESLVGNQTARLIGSSMGGYLAALYASTHPSIERLVLLAPAFGFSSRWPELLGPELLRQWRDTGWLEVFHHAERAMRRVHYDLFTDASKYPANPDFRQPALIFHGVHDPVVPVELSRSFAAEHSRALLTEMDSDHELLDVLEPIVAASLPFLLA